MDVTRRKALGTLKRKLCVVQSGVWGLPYCAPDLSQCFLSQGEVFTYVTSFVKAVFRCLTEDTKLVVFDASATKCTQVDVGKHACDGVLIVCALRLLHTAA